MADHTTTRRTLLAGSLGGSALGGLVLTTDAEAAVSVPSDPAVDFFVALAGLPGESQDAQFPKTFDTLDWSFGATTSVSPTNTGNGVGKVKPQPFVFVKRVDKASPILFMTCATGKHFPSATPHRTQARRQGALPRGRAPRRLHLQLPDDTGLRRRPPARRGRPRLPLGPDHLHARRTPTAASGPRSRPASTSSRTRCSDRPAA